MLLLRSKLQYVADVRGGYLNNSVISSVSLRLCGQTAVFGIER